MLEPIHAYLIAYKGLHANAAPRAAAVLTEGCQVLMHHAASPDREALRRSWLDRVPENRELCEAYATAFVSVLAPSFDKLLP